MSMPTQIIKIPLYQIADIQLDIHSIKIWSDNECFRMFSFQHVHSAHAYTHTYMYIVKWNEGRKGTV